MSCSSTTTPVTKDFMKKQDTDHHLDMAQSDVDKNKEANPDAGSEKGSPKTDLKLGNYDNMSAISMFRKYLHARAQHSMEEPGITKKSPPRALLPPKPGSNLPRPISFLEKKLFPGISRTDTPDDKPPAARLTIFYAGAVNVFDNIPIDKAQAIMLLAGESSIPSPVATKLPKSDRATIRQSNIPSICKLQADLPIARRRSIQSFLEKRRDRIIQKSPYGSGNKHQDDEPTRDDGSKGTEIFRPSPFPSRLGYFSVSANKLKVVKASVGNM